MTVPAQHLLPGDQFILDGGDDLEAIWGGGQRMVWPRGEPLMVVGPTGIGKSTLAHNLLRPRLGLGDAIVLGLPVQASAYRVLYFACDRPRQLRRAFRRLFSEADRTVLHERLLVHYGPPPFDLTRKPTALVEMASKHRARTIVLDSLKDMARDLVKDESGIALNQALQHCVASKIEVLVLHHQRKGQAENKKPRALDDVYGSTWITAGAGSVVLLWGEPGDLRLELRHLKKPMDDVGPLDLIHDPETGLIRLDPATDLLELARVEPGGLTAAAGASRVYKTAEPNRNQIERIRRRLEAMSRSGELIRQSDPDKPKAPVLYTPAPGAPA